MKTLKTLLLLFCLMATLGSIAGTYQLTGDSIDNISDKRFNKAYMYYSGGIGFPNYASVLSNFFDTKDYFGIDSIINFSEQGFGPFHFKFEKAVRRNIGLGLSVNYVTNTFNMDAKYHGLSYPVELKRTNLSIIFRFNHHFYSNKKVDWYYGLGVGIRRNSFEWNTTPGVPLSYKLKFNFGIPYGIEISQGMRYYFNEKLAFYYEFGLTKSLIQVGMTYSVKPKPKKDKDKKKD